ncbi:MAG: hypothetical protein M3177_11565 [Pseudomonadota bacterium]|nr:hypothetical protein [Pseudomonadota bacterium]
MAREPTYPTDAPVGEPGTADDPAGSATSGEQQKRSEEKAAGSIRTRHLVTGAAIGIGSAALVAALLYANRARKGGDEARRSSQSSKGPAPESD